MEDPVSYRELIRQGFESINTRIDDQTGTLRDDMHRMHRETALRIQNMDERINGKFTRVHERLSTLEEITRTLKEEFQGIRDRWHKFRESIQTAVSKLVQGNGQGVAITSEERPITRKELGWVIALIIGSITIGAGVTIWILKVAAP